MQKHTKVYLDYFGYGEQDTIICEVSDNKAVDIHHIYAKGMGGRKTFNHEGGKYEIESIQNLIALCRKCHEKAHSGEHSKDFLWYAHKLKMVGGTFFHRK